MNDEDKKLYEPYPQDVTNHLCWAIKSLSEALCERFRPSVPHKVSTAKKYLNQFFESITELPKLTEEESELARSLHTYLRKYCDCYLTTALYNFIAAGKGTILWYNFVKSLVKYNEKPNQVKIAKRNLAETERQTDDDLIMCVLLTQWKDEEISQALKDIKKWQ
jgi:hypothetical protein